MKKAPKKQKIQTDIFLLGLTKLPKPLLLNLAESYDAVPLHKGRLTKRKIAACILEKVRLSDLQKNPVINPNVSEGLTGSN